MTEPTYKIITEVSSVPFVCPVCTGNGLVPNGFYLRAGTQGGSTSSLEPETCRSCNGTGIVWSKEDDK